METPWKGISSSRRTEAHIRRYNEGGMLAARTAVVLSIAGIGYGFQQAPSPQPAAVQTGLETPWDVRKIVADLKRTISSFSRCSRAWTRSNGSS